MRYLLPAILCLLLPRPAQPCAPPNDTHVVESTFPEADAVDVPTNAPLVFIARYDPEIIDSLSEQLHLEVSLDGAPVAGALDPLPPDRAFDRIARWRPVDGWQPGARYTVALAVGGDPSRSGPPEPYDAWSFTTRADAAPAPGIPGLRYDSHTFDGTRRECVEVDDSGTCDCLEYRQVDSGWKVGGRVEISPPPSGRAAWVQLHAAPSLPVLAESNPAAAAPFLDDEPLSLRATAGPLADWPTDVVCLRVDVIDLAGRRIQGPAECLPVEAVPDETSGCQIGGAPRGGAPLGGSAAMGLLVLALLASGLRRPRTRSNG